MLLPLQIFLPQRTLRVALRRKAERRNFLSSFETLGLISFLHDLSPLRIFFIAKSAEGGAQERKAKEQESPIFFK